MSGTQALRRLIEVAERDSGQSEIIRCFLLSLYNGNGFPLVPFRLRNLDRNLIEDVLEVLRMDLTDHQAEIHNVIPDSAHLWFEWREWYEITNAGSPRFN
jgi:hypothetical protein